MTAQITDTILINRRLYDVCGIHGDAPFSAEGLGVVPIAPHTACWRGYVNQYRIFRRRLVLEQLVLYLGDSDDDPVVQGASPRGPVINGVEPRLNMISETMGENFYDRLHLPLPFTGGILGGRGFRRDLYVHMGFPPAWKFNEVHEAVFEQGALKELRDVSEQIAIVRDRMLKKLLRPDLPEVAEAELLAWVQSAFRLDYDWGAWL